MESYVPMGLFLFTLAIVNAGFAEQKSRSKLAWFFLSFILGPFATAFIVIWPPPEKATLPSIVASR